MTESKRNILKEYTSVEIKDKIIINDVYKNLYYPLSENFANELKNLILLDGGCLSPLIIDDIFNLLDGHQRLKICIELNLPFKVIQMFFNSEEDKISWIRLNQSTRRNLNTLALSYSRGALYNLSKLSGICKGNQYTKVLSEEASDNKIDTAKQIGMKERVSDRTIRSDGKFAERLDSIVSEIEKINPTWGYNFKNDYLTSQEKWANKETLISLKPDNFKEFSEKIYNQYRINLEVTNNIGNKDDICDNEIVDTENIIGGKVISGSKNNEIKEPTFSSLNSVIQDIRNSEKVEHKMEETNASIVSTKYRIKTEEEINLINESFKDIELKNLSEFIVKQTSILSKNSYEFSNDNVKIVFSIIGNPTLHNFKTIKGTKDKKKLNHV